MKSPSHRKFFTIFVEQILIKKGSSFFDYGVELLMIKFASFAVATTFYKTKPKNVFGFE